ncbi:S1 family peptidase [Microbulbifer sp. S227A]|uniref:S1 family peptidase n=1 Tax=Microbulbifer sp. S227A TaxID=3415131 RepID=UPI003C7E2C6D
MLAALRGLLPGLWLGLAVGGTAAWAQELNPDSYPPKVAEVIKHSVVRLGDARSSGTGFLVSNQGHIVTAWHVLESINQRRVPNGKISFVKSIYQVNFSGAGRECRVLADLIGASVFRDIAALRIRPHTWAKRDEDGHCLNGVRPVEIDWHLDPTVDASQLDYPYYSAPHFPIGFPAKCADWTKDAPRWAGQGNGFHCPLRGFNAFKTGVRRAEDELGLIELSEAVEHGFSGGPVVLENGRVVGMTILRDWEEKNAVSRLIPSPMLEGPLWTFGVAVDKQNRVLGDHHEAMLDYIARKDEIVHALEAFEEMYSFLSVPELLGKQSGFLRVRQPGKDDVYLPQFMFERRWANAPDPAKFDVSHSCIPRDPALASLLLFNSVAVQLQALRDKMFANYRYEMTIPVYMVATSGGAGALPPPPRSPRYPLQVTGSMTSNIVDLTMLLWQCSSMHQMMLGQVIADFNSHPEKYHIVKDGQNQLRREGEIIKSYLENGLPDMINGNPYKEIVFSIAAVFSDGSSETLRHPYEKVVLSLDPIQEVGHGR